jgi:hypothetical protein
MTKLATIAEFILVNSLLLYYATRCLKLGYEGLKGGWDERAESWPSGKLILLVWGIRRIFHIVYFIGNTMQNRITMGIFLLWVTHNLWFISS